MAFRKIHFHRFDASFIYFYSDKIVFPAKVLREYGIVGRDQVAFGIDSETQRLFFRFQDGPDATTLPFAFRSEKSEDRMIHARVLYRRYAWLAAAGEVKETARKRFPLQLCTSLAVAPPEDFRFYVQPHVGPWRGLRFQPKIFPRGAGVFWLYNEFGDVLRIGETENLAASLYQHWQQMGQEVKFFDYELIASSRKRLRTSNEYIHKYVQESGQEPKYNPLLLSKKKR